MRLFYSVWKSPKKSHLGFWIRAFPTNFCPIKIDLSGNTVWPQTSKTRQIVLFLMNFCLNVYSKCKRSSLRSQCWMRLIIIPYYSVLFCIIPFYPTLFHIVLYFSVLFLKSTLFWQNQVTLVKKRWQMLEWVERFLTFCHLAK